MAPSTRPRISSPDSRARLLGRIGREGQAQGAALFGVGEHRGGVVGPDDHQFGRADGGHHVGHLDVAGLRHRTRVERGDLRHVQVGGADEAGGVLGVGDQHAAAVDAGGLQPFAVVGEIHTCRTHQYGVSAQHADGVRHVAGHPAPVDHEIVDEEAQRHLLQMLGQELLGEPPGNRIRWSVAMDPVTAIVTKCHALHSSNRPGRALACVSRADYMAPPHCGADVAPRC